ncbi:MAG: MOSC domain-containing protein [Methanobacteriota archaeon]
MLSVGEGIVDSIHIASNREGPMVSVPEVRAVAGRGLEGDRYYRHEGTYSSRPGPDRELTLIEIESIEALARDFAIRVDPSDSRRNIATRDVALNHLVGREFLVGSVRLRGIRLCEPCAHLARLTGKELIAGLVHRGGLRAAILTDGTIRVGDPIRVRASPPGEPVAGPTTTARTSDH